MTRMLARPEPPLGAIARGLARGARSCLLALAALAGMMSFVTTLQAAPLALESESDIAALAERLRDYGDASRVRWVVAARTRADALAAIARIEAHLPAADRRLSARLIAQAFEETTGGVAGPAVRAWISPQIGSASGGPSCSWQVWVTDPNFPSPDADPVTVPLAPNDRLPVGPAATFRVGHSGLLQTRLYAFDETRPGAIRDLATARDVNVPVATQDGAETIFLAMARETAPFLESVKALLAASDGRRRDLGQRFALRDKWLGQGRGIGANIQSIPPEMIAGKRADTVVVSANTPEAGSDSLMETCVYALTPAR